MRTRAFFSWSSSSVGARTPARRRARSDAAVRRAIGLACALAVAAGGRPAAAQNADRQVRGMVEQAMEDFQGLEIESAMTRLRVALRSCGNNRCSPRQLARVHMAMGVVAVGGQNNTDAGVEAFVAGLQLDPDVEPDTLYATPEIRAAFTQAQRRAGTGAGGSRTGTGGSGDTGTGRTGSPPRGTGGGDGALRHTPWPEQLENTPLPVFVEPENGLTATRYTVHYRGLGMSNFASAGMERMANGYGAEIPCGQVIQPNVEYYVTASDGDGNVVASVATPQSPVRVHIVSSRTQPPPSLPGRMPAEQCREDCPPGMSGPQCGHGGSQRGSRQLGDPCESNNQCGTGLHCAGGACASGEAPSTTPSGPDRQYRFAFNLGVGGGFAFVSGTPCPQGSDNPMNPGTPLTCRGVSAMEPSYIQPYAEFGDFSDDMMLNPTCGPSTESNNTFACVTNVSGFAPAFYLYANVFVRLVERLGVGVSVRFQPDGASVPRSNGAAALPVLDPDGTPFGQSVARAAHSRYTLANFLFAARVYYAVTSGGWVRNGLVIAPFVGGGVGQIQAHPGIANGSGITPHIPSGLGNINAGARVEYGFANFVHIGADLALNFQLPQFLFVIDAQATVGMHF
jgi:hypothetical protein